MPPQDHKKEGDNAQLEHEMAYKRYSRRAWQSQIIPFVIFAAALFISLVIGVLGFIESGSELVLKIQDALLLVMLFSLATIPLYYPFGFYYIYKRNKVPWTAYDKRSGAGAESTIPPEISGFSWGALGLTWVWSMRHGNYSGMYVLVPVVNIIWPFILGFKGSEQAWRTTKWKDVGEYLRVQKQWNIVGKVLFTLNAVYTVLVLLLLISIL